MQRTCDSGKPFDLDDRAASRAKESVPGAVPCGASHFKAAIKNEYHENCTGLKPSRGMGRPPSFRCTRSRNLTPDPDLVVAWSGNPKSGGNPLVRPCGHSGVFSKVFTLIQWARPPLLLWILNASADPVSGGMVSSQMTSGTFSLDFGPALRELLPNWLSHTWCTDHK